MKTRKIFPFLCLYLFSFFSVSSMAANVITTDELIKLKADAGSFKRSVSLPPEQIASASRLGHQLNLSFYLPLGTVQISVYSCGELIFQDQYDISSADVTIPIYLEDFEDGQSRIEIGTESGYLYGVF